MKIERTQNATRNIIFGVALKCYQIIFPFIMRTAILYFMGVQYLGLDSLFASILQVLNLAELGVGSAMVYSMYKPIVNNDAKMICALMKLYRVYYRVIGLVIAVVGLILVPFVPKLVKGGVPSDLNIYILYLINLGATVLSYWLFAYKNSILMAYQRNDVVSKVSLFTTTLQYVLQLGVVVFVKNYYVFLIIMLFAQLLNNIVTAVFANKMYPQYSPKGELTREEISAINQRIRDLFTSKIGGVIVNSADTIVISAFLGLAVLAIYQNYYYIVKALISVVAVIFASCTAGIGNSIIVESKEKNFKDLNKFTFLISWIAGFCSCCLLCMYQPFMEIWVGKKLMLSFSAVICFCIYFYVFEINQLLNTYKDAAGIWHEDRFRPLVTALANLVMNLVMVQFWGIYGVLLSTVLSMVFIGMPWIIYNLFTTLFDRKDLKKYVKKLFVYSFVVILACSITWLVCSFIHFNAWMTLIVRGVICCIIPNIIFLISFRKKSEFKDTVQLIDRMTKGRLKLEKMIR